MDCLNCPRSKKRIDYDTGERIAVCLIYAKDASEVTYDECDKGEYRDRSVTDSYE